MHWMPEEQISDECRAEVLALEEKWQLRLYTKAAYEARNGPPVNTPDINRRLAQLERSMWGHECGPRD